MANAKGAPQGPDRQKMMTVLVPAVGVAGLILLIAAVALFSSGDKGRPMSDGSDGSADDPAMTNLGGGLKIRDLRVGNGDAVPPAAEVKVRYTGWLPNGVVFDSGTSPFELVNVVVGWQKGIPGMKRGGIRKLVIPPELAYGAQSKGKIPPNSTLIFEVELLDIVNVRGEVPANLSDGTAPGADDPALKDIGEGLRVRDLKEGSGPEAKPNGTVVVHYTGWLLNGQSFDSSRKTGRPYETSLNNVVAGWQKGIPGMKVGGVRKLVIPADLGYGMRAQSGIPPNSTLVFEVELLEVR